MDRPDNRQIIGLVIVAVFIGGIIYFVNRNTKQQQDVLLVGEMRTLMMLNDANVRRANINIAYTNFINTLHPSVYNRFYNRLNRAYNNAMITADIRDIEFLESEARIVYFENQKKLMEISATNTVNISGGTGSTGSASI
jgi:hypothetical protein